MRLSHLAKLSGALILTTGLAGAASAQSYSYAQNTITANIPALVTTRPLLQ